ncbi:hypothetical protein ACGYLO_18175 [Sulfitobacter sp. 1A13353]|uniref:hypothetical protein n=1 Tax=Sulfitobacter sp. 1A13353 TaxID=3368568 RepID=UPI003745267F
MKMSSPLAEVPWSRLQGTEIFIAAMTHQAANARRHYHNAAHVQRLYWHAAVTFQLPYSRALDLAILTHDVIFDCRQDRELRSIDWLAAHLPDGEDDPDFLEAKRYIASTIDHRLTEHPEMVLLDLADFIDPKVSLENTDLLRKEARDLNGVAPEIFAMGCSSYLEGLHDRFKQGAAQLPATLLYIHTQICRGILNTRKTLHDACKQMERSYV